MKLLKKRLRNPADSTEDEAGDSLDDLAKLFFAKVVKEYVDEPKSRVRVTSTHPMIRYVCDFSPKALGPFTGRLTFQVQEKFVRFVLEDFVVTDRLDLIGMKTVAQGSFSSRTSARSCSGAIAAAVASAGFSDY